MGGFDSAPQTESTKFSMVGDHRSQQNAFDQLQQALKRATENPLYPFDLSKPLHLFTDASSSSVSVALTKVDDNGKHLPVAFVSTKMTESQRNWSVIEREAFSLIVFLR